MAAVRRTELNHESPEPERSNLSVVALDSGVTLSYAAQGRARATALVLLPGPTDAWRSYQPILDRLPPETYAIAVSQRGHGDSAKPKSGYAVQDFAADVASFLDVCGIERAVLAGHSGSCFVARRVALDHPERVAGLILEASPTALHDDAALVRAVRELISNLEDPIPPDFARSFVTDTSSVGVPADLIDVLVEDVLKVPAPVWTEMLSALLTYDDLSELARIAAPTLLVWGDADGLVSRDMQDRLLHSIPKAELLIYRGAGHTPRWDDPARFSSDLVAFAQQAAQAAA